MQINVTQEIIDESDRLRTEDNYSHRRSQCCPVAMAVRVAGFTRATVGFDMVGWDGMSFNLPPKVAIFINDSDHKLPVQPFSFELDLEAARVD